MTGREVRLRERAARDVDGALAWYRSEGGDALAERFVDALESAVRHVAAHPLSGSTRYAHWLQIPELRTWPLHRFPYILFYVADETRIDVWRMLHAERDLPDWMRAE